MIAGLIMGDGQSYLRQNPGWEPTYGTDGSFTTVDLLKAAGSSPSSDRPITPGSRAGPLCARQTTPGTAADRWHRSRRIRRLLCRTGGA